VVVISWDVARAAMSNEVKYVRSCGPVHCVQIQRARSKLGSLVRVKSREKVLDSWI
jgi:hypothetical protein